MTAARRLAVILEEIADIGPEYSPEGELRDQGISPCSLLAMAGRNDEDGFERIAARMLDQVGEGEYDLNGAGDLKLRWRVRDDRTISFWIGGEHSDLYTEAAREVERILESHDLLEERRFLPTPSSR